MVSITLSVPEEIQKLMRQFPEINWSGYLRKCIEEKARRLVWREQMLKELEYEEKFDKIALDIGSKIKEDAWKRYKKDGW